MPAVLRQVNVAASRARYCIGCPVDEPRQSSQRYRKCYISQNQADKSGGVACSGGAFARRDSVINSNRAHIRGANWYVDSVDLAESIRSIENSQFKDLRRLEGSGGSDQIIDALVQEIFRKREQIVSP